MNCIYSPKGRAREYSPKALNIYLRCTHGCDYCYCKRLRGTNFFGVPEPRNGIVESLKKELDNKKVTEQTLLSFMGDVYCETSDNNKATRDCLEVLLEKKVPVAILTKGGNRPLKDIDLFKRFDDHIQVGTTLTFSKDEDSQKYEPGAALPEERLSMLENLHHEGIRTFVSFEPVIDPEQAIEMIVNSLDFVDVYKIGKINNYKGIDQSIDWTKFLEEAIDILRSNDKAFYVKHDLRQAAPTIKLYGNECLADEHNVS